MDDNNNIPIIIKRIVMEEFKQWMEGMPKSAIPVKVKKLVPEAKLPEKAHPTDFGADLTVVSRMIDAYGNVVYGFGVALEIPEGYVGLLFPRSSNAKKDLLLSNGVGCIDCHYRGEIMAKFKTLFRCLNEEWDSNDLPVYNIGDKAAQLAIIPYPEINYIEAEELSDTDRGAGGYGSTGK